jgi:hypothetical protein
MTLLDAAARANVGRGTGLHHKRLLEIRIETVGASRCDTVPVGASAEAGD